MDAILSVVVSGIFLLPRQSQKIIPVTSLPDLHWSITCTISRLILGQDWLTSSHSSNLTIDLTHAKLVSILLHFRIEVGFSLFSPPR